MYIYIYIYYVCIHIYIYIYIYTQRSSSCLSSFSSMKAQHLERHIVSYYTALYVAAAYYFVVDNVIV